MKEGYTHIVVVLDSSGSMQMVLNDTIGGFNTFLKAQKKAEGEATMTLVEFVDMGIVAPGHLGSIPPPLFCDQQSYDLVNKVPYKIHKVPLKVIYNFMPIKSVPKLNTTNYVPSGMTPLLDTIGEVLVRTGKALRNMAEMERPSKVLFVIITDGEENASRTYNFQKISEMIRHQNIVYKWEFVFLGANQDAIGEASKMGINSATAITYGTNKESIGSVYDTLAARTSTYRGIGVTCQALAFHTSDRISAMQSGNVSEKVSNSNG